MARYHTWDHTPSWLFLAEVLEFDWDQRTKHYGVIPFIDYRDWRASGGCPRSYSGDVLGGNVRVLTRAQADDALRKYDDGTFWVRPGEPRDGTEVEDLYVRVAWTESYRDSTEDFLAFVEEFVLPLVPPEAWGGHVSTIAEIADALADAVNSSGAAGLMRKPFFARNKPGP